METGSGEEKEMNNVDIKKTTTTQMKIKKATINDGKFYIDGEEINLLALLSSTFEDCVFDVAVTEKTVEEQDGE